MEHTVGVYIDKEEPLHFMYFFNRFLAHYHKIELKGLADDQKKLEALRTNTASLFCGWSKQTMSLKLRYEWEREEGERGREKNNNKFTFLLCRTRAYMA